MLLGLIQWGPKLQTHVPSYRMPDCSALHQVTRVIFTPTLCRKDRGCFLLTRGISRGQGHTVRPCCSPSVCSQHRGQSPPVLNPVLPCAQKPLMAPLSDAGAYKACTWTSPTWAPSLCPVYATWFLALKSCVICRELSPSLLHLPFKAFTLSYYVAQNPLFFWTQVLPVIISCPGWTQTFNPPTSAFHSAEIKMCMTTSSP